MDMNDNPKFTQTDEHSQERIILNSKLADSSSKIIFDDPILCSQFLRDYIELPYFKDIQPEDIEDVSEQYVPLFAEERNADRVKKVNIKNENPFFLISLIEHKTKVDYNVTMQIFRYMVYIWEAYAKEAEKIQKDITKRVDFKYPPILPIVYYEGNDNWTVPYDFKSRIIEGDIFEKYVPNFEYYLVPLRKYSNEELLEKQDEISLVMLINRMQNISDIEAFRKLPVQKVEEILKNTPEHILDIISNILRAFLLKMNLPENEAEELVGKVKDKKMGYLFENMEKIDIQEERRRISEERSKMAEEKREMAEEKREMAEEKREMAEEKREMAEEKRKISEERSKIAEEKKHAAEDAIRLTIETCQELGILKEHILLKIKEKYSLTEKEANEKVDLYWKKKM